VLLTVALAWLVSRGVCRALKRDPSVRDKVVPRYERWRTIHLFLVLGLYALDLCLLGWGWSVGQLWRWSPQQLLPLPELVLLTPFLVSLVLSWVVFYDADLACYQAAHRLLGVDPLARSLLEQDPHGPAAAQTERPLFGGRWSWVLFKLRQQLVMVFLPVVLLMGQKELHRQVPLTWQQGELLLTLLGIVIPVAVFVFLPWIIRLILGLRPLPDGPLRQRLQATAARLNFRCADILLWNTHRGMANAMVVGLVPWIRYVIFTDRLLDEFTPEEVEAVFGHEAGHAKHQHMLYYLGFLFASMVVLGLVVARLQPWIPGMSGSSVAEAGSGEDPNRYLTFVPLMAVLLAYIFLVFGFLSRRCERQADIYGCRAVSCSRSDCAGHDPGEPLASGGKYLCPTGVRTFMQALEKVALVNGINRERPGFLQSWQHSTIARRVAFLGKVLADPRVEPRFQWRVALVKVGLFVVLGLILLLLMGTNGWAI
jgi:Zn-dependent protease with chaperone function